MHTSSENKAEHSVEYQKFPFAISRYKSGSHIMAYVHAKNHNWPLENNTFNVVGGLDGALQALKEDPKQLFLWEKFTTKPFVDNGELRLLEECPTPWPSFVIAVRDEYLSEHYDTVQKVLEIVKANTNSLMSSAETPHIIAERYHLKFEDTVQWFNQLEWAPQSLPNAKEIQNVVNSLLDIGLLAKKYSKNEIKDLVLFTPVLGSSLI